jgi:murein DD-endopeptidase MepM/ murein hydrolase activator NlpD
MRFQEFKVKENIAPFMQAMIGGNVSPFSSVMSSEKDKTSNDSKTDTTDNTQTTKSDSSGKPIDAAAGSPFGMRNGKPHNGTDFPTPIGTPVKAPESGLISRTGSDKMNGNFVVIKSGDTDHFLLHLSKINVSDGQRVKQGEVVGLSGNTGHSTGPHLHWEKRVAGRPVDPMSNVG